MLAGFEVGHGVCWSADDKTMAYGVIVADADDMLTIVSVEPLSDDKRCYDESGATWAEDRDDVRLDGCPPPFTLLCVTADRGCYAHADFIVGTKMLANDIDQYGLRCVDGGDKVPDSTMSIIFNHPWHDELEREKIHVGESQSVTPVFEPAPEPAAKPLSAYARMMQQYEASNKNDQDDTKSHGPDFC